MRTLIYQYTIAISFVAFLTINLNINSFAQLAAKGASINNEKKNKIAIPVSFDKRVTLIFPDIITEDVIGNNRVSISKNKNKYFITAFDTKGFTETSLFITLASGHFYDIKLIYKPVIDTAVYVFYPKDSDGLDPFVNSQDADSATSETLAGNGNTPFKLAEEFIANSNEVLKRPVSFTDKGVIGQSLVFFLQSIYHDEANDKLYIRIAAKNFSNADFDIKSIKFHVVPNKGILKNVAGDQQEIKPVFILNGHKSRVEGNSSISKVFVFDNFKLTANKDFIVEICEGTSGYKQLQFSITRQDLEKAIALR